MKKVLVILAFAFLTAAGILMLTMVLPELRRRDIAENGVITIAEVTGYNSSFRQNDVQYYYIRFEYADESGAQKSGRTSGAYTLAQAEKIMYIGTLEIKYSNRGAVQADYKPGVTLLIGKTISAVFLFVGVSALIPLIWYAFVAIRFSLSEENTGRCVDIDAIGQDAYRIVIEYQDRITKDTVRAKTQAVYSKSQADYLMELEELNIKCCKKRVKILEND